VDSHRDHRAVAALTLDAWLAARKQFALYYYEVAEDTMMFRPDEWYPKQVEITRARGKASGHQQAEGFLRHAESKRGLLPA
jgi:hypothetical protein